VWWGVECGRDAMGSGSATRWGVECRRGTVGSGVPARCGGERRRGVVGSGDGGVRRDSMGIGERSAECGAGAGEVGFSSEGTILYTLREDFELLDLRELTFMMNQA
jgi:hypothetical protein